MAHMTKALRISLFTLAGVAGALALAVFAMLVFVDVDAYKPRVEAAASAATGMDVTVEGPLRIGFLPGLHVVLNDVHIRNGETEIAFVTKLELAIELLSLLRQELRFESIALNRARITIARDRDGKYNYETPPKAAKTPQPLYLPTISLSELDIVYLDSRSGRNLELGNCNARVTDLHHPGAAPLPKRLSLSGLFECAEVRGMDIALSDLRIPMVATEGVFILEPVTMHVGGGQGSGSLRMDLSGESPDLALSYTLSKFRVEEFLKSLPPGKSVSGQMDFSTALTLRGQTGIELVQSSRGELSLSGSDLTLTGVDLDKAFSNYESSQNFSLFDAGAILLTGPIGLTISKGYDFSSLALQSGGSTKIREVVSVWKVEKGVARAGDVALATNENRLAIQGGLDFVKDEYDELVMALVDSRGCAIVGQKIQGPFGKPVVEKPGVLKSLAGPILNLAGKARDLFGDPNDCEVFYAGSVAAPATAPGE